MKKNVILKTIVSISCVFLFCSCVKVQDAEEDKPKASISAASDQDNSNSYQGNLDSYILMGSEVNDYQVQLDFPPQSQSVQRMLVDDSKTLTRLELNVANGKYIDTKPILGRQSIYQFGHINNGNYIIDKQVQVSVPIDYMLDRSLALDQPLTLNQYRRVFFAEGVKLLTNGYSFSINAEEMIAPDLQIETFSEGSTLSSQNGKAGGSIVIKAKSGEGKINLVLRGQNGGKGKTPAALAPDIAVDPCPNGPWLPGGKQMCSAWGKMIVGPNAYEDMDPVKLQTHPQPLRGRNGDQGFNGGDSGTVQITITEQHHLQFSHSIFVGQGGEGGDGGKGQYVERNDYKAQGADGDKGARGYDGKAGSFCYQDLQSKYCEN